MKKVLLWVAFVILLYAGTTTTSPWTCVIRNFLLLKIFVWHFCLIFPGDTSWAKINHRMWVNYLWVLGSSLVFVDGIQDNSSLWWMSVPPVQQYLCPMSRKLNQGTWSVFWVGSLETLFSFNAIGAVYQFRERNQLNRCWAVQINE